MRKNTTHLFQTIWLICRNAPVRFLASIGLLMVISAFPLLNLMAVNTLVTRLAEDLASPLEAAGGGSMIAQAQRLLLPGAAFILTLLLKNAGPFINILGSYLWISAELALQEALLEKAAGKRFCFYDTPSYYESLQKAKEGCKNAVSTAMMLVSAIFVSLLSTVWIAGYLGQVDWRILAALALIVCAKSLACRLQTRRLQALRERQAGEIKNRELLASYFWTKETRVYGACGHFLDKYKRKNELLAKEGYFVERRCLWTTFLLDSLSYLFYGGVMMLAVYGMLRGSHRISAVSGIVLLFTAMDTIFANIGNVAAQFGAFMQNAALSGDLFAFLAEEDAAAEPRKFLQERPAPQAADFRQERPEPQAADSRQERPAPQAADFRPSAVLRLENVSFRYPLARQAALKKLNLTVYQGEKIAVMGRNGSGKSTLVKLLCGLYEPSEGAVRYGQALHLQEYGYGNIAAMFQRVNTYDMSLAENISISRTQEPPEPQRAGAILAKVMGEDWLLRYPEGMDTRIGRTFGGTELSGGEKQKLSLARTFYRAGTLLFFDEPNSALDPLAEDKVYRQIAELSRGITSFFITHRLASVKLADRIIVLEKGEIAEEGSFEALMARNELFAEMYAMQRDGYTG